LRGPATVVLRLDRLDAEPGAYRFDVGVYEREWRYAYDYHWQAYPPEVAETSGAAFGPPRRWEIH
jgi:lipopolysaccharide transport system ATP-binding protein